MEALTLLTEASVDVVALVLLLIFLVLFLIFTVRAKSGARFRLRPIAAYARLQQLISQATESGRPIHVGMGSGEIGSSSTTEALMGLTVLDLVARHAAASDMPVLGSTGNPTVLAAGQGVLQVARREAGYAESYTGRELGFYAPVPLAYAAGVEQDLMRNKYLASILLGRYGTEGLWISESVGAQPMVQLGGTVEPTAQALLQFSLDEAVIGEEVYAAGAYLHRPSHLGSLATQDSVRIVLILSIIAGVIMLSLGYWR
jgi:hypothetical protein